MSGETLDIRSLQVISWRNVYAVVAQTLKELIIFAHSDEAAMKDWLGQLQEGIEESELSAPKKRQALEQLKAIVEAGQNPQDVTMQSKAEMAVGFLEVIAKGVEPASKLAQTCTQVLPNLLIFFGL